MTPILTSAQMREADRRAIEEHGIPSLVLMENAARGACDILSLLLGSLKEKKIAVICGKGNNGGDGLAMARHARIRGADAYCLLLADPDDLSSDAGAQFHMLTSFGTEYMVPWDDLRKVGNELDVIVDAVVGTGATGPLRKIFANIVDWANDRECFRFALDIPSGIDADTGLATGIYFQADATATMAALKPGLLLGTGAIAAGDVYVVDIGVLPELYEDSGLELLDTERWSELLPTIEPGRNKYDRGKVLVAAGSRGMTGAAVMAAEAALRAGSGLTVLALPADAALSLPQYLSPEIMTMHLPSGDEGAFAPDAFAELVERSESYGAIAVGPGISRSTGAAEAVRKLVAGSRAPLVLDADGLNAFAGKADDLAHRNCELVITPHHGEMARLLEITSDTIGADPLKHAREAARRMNCVVVLKGAPTVVALPDGRAWINGAGNPGMATGGTGDVLTGIIASLIGQTGDIVKGTLAGVYLHSLAGDIAARTVGTRSLVATDIIAHIPDAYAIQVQEPGR